MGSRLPCAIASITACLMVESGASTFVPLFWSPSTARNFRFGGMTAPLASAGISLYTGALPSKLCAATRRLRVGAFVDTRVPVKPDVAFLTLESSTLSTKNLSARPIAAEMMNAVPALTMPSAARPTPRTPASSPRSTLRPMLTSRCVPFFGSLRTL